MDHLLEFFHSEHDEDLLDIDLHILQAWLLVAPSSKYYIVFTVLFHKDEVANFAVTNGMSHFYMFVPTKVTVKLATRNTRHAQGMGVVLCRFPNFPIIYPVGPVYYCPGCPSNTISLGTLIFYVGFQKFTSEPLEHCIFFTPKVVLRDHHTRLKKKRTIFKSKLSK